MPYISIINNKNDDFMKTKAILIGSSSRIGQALIKELAALYETVILITRTAPKRMSENMQIYQVGDFQSLASAMESVAIDANTDAFSCLGATRSQVMSDDEFYQVNVLYNMEFARICKSKGVTHFYYLSKEGVDEPKDDNELIAKADVEYYLRSLQFDQLSIFRLYKLTASQKTPLLSSLTLGSLQSLKNAASASGAWLKGKRPLTPKQVAVNIALGAYEHPRQYNENHPLFHLPKCRIVRHSEMQKIAAMAGQNQKLS